MIGVCLGYCAPSAVGLLLAAVFGFRIVLPCISRAIRLAAEMSRSCTDFRQNCGRNANPLLNTYISGRRSVAHNQESSMDKQADLIKIMSDVDPGQVLCELACLGAFIALRAAATLAMAASSTAPTLEGRNQPRKNP